MSEWIVDPDFGVRPSLPQCPVTNIDGETCDGDVEVINEDFLCGNGIIRNSGDYDMCDHKVTRRCIRCAAHLCEDCMDGNTTDR